MCMRNQPISYRVQFHAKDYFNNEAKWAKSISEWKLYFASFSPIKMTTGAWQSQNDESCPTICFALLSFNLMWTNSIEVI